MIKPFLSFGLLALLLGGTGDLSAQILNKQTVSLELAKKIASKAETEAAKHQWTVVIAIVDDGGNLIYLEKMDGTQGGSVDVAQRKAKTAIQFKRPTKAFEDVITGGRVAILSLDILGVEGGIPLVVDGNPIGAIGVSGMKSNEDGIVAQAGLLALASP